MSKETETILNFINSKIVGKVYEKGDLLLKMIDIPFNDLSFTVLEVEKSEGIFISTPDIAITIRPETTTYKYEIDNNQTVIIKCKEVHFLVALNEMVYVEKCDIIN